MPATRNDEWLRFAPVLDPQTDGSSRFPGSNFRVGFRCENTILWINMQRFEPHSLCAPFQPRHESGSISPNSPGLHRPPLNGCKRFTFSPKIKLQPLIATFVTISGMASLSLIAETERKSSHEFFVSPTGSDANSGTSISSNSNNLMVPSPNTSAGMPGSPSTANKSSTMPSNCSTKRASSISTGRKRQSITSPAPAKTWRLQR